MRETDNHLEFLDNPDKEEYSIDLVSVEGGLCNAEVAVARSRGAAKTKAKKRLTELLKELDSLDADEVPE